MNTENDNMEALYNQKCEEYETLSLEYEEMKGRFLNLCELVIYIHRYQ